MKDVYLLFSADQWHMHDSKRFMGVFSTKKRALKYLEVVKKVGYRNLDDLYHQGQTQGL